MSMSWVFWSITLMIVGALIGALIGVLVTTPHPPLIAIASTGAPHYARQGK